MSSHRVCVCLVRVLNVPQNRNITQTHTFCFACACLICSMLESTHPQQPTNQPTNKTQSPQKFHKNISTKSNSKFRIRSHSCQSDSSLICLNHSKPILKKKKHPHTNKQTNNNKIVMSCECACAYLPTTIHNQASE